MLNYIQNEDSTINNHLTTSLFDNLPVAIYTCDSLGRITSFNKAAAQLWEREPELGKDLWCGSLKISYANGAPMPLDNWPMARAFKIGIAVKDELMIVERPDGTKIKVKPHAIPLFDDNDILTGGINTLIDVTSLVGGEEKQAVLAAIVSTSDDTILSKTLQGIITSWNKAAENMFGYTEAEAIGRHISFIIPPARIKEEEYIISQIVSGNRVDHFETIRIAKDGHEIPLSLSISPIKDSTGKIIGASKIARDISAQREAREIAQRYTERLEIINMMVQSVSEELDLNKILQKVTDATTALTGATSGAFFYNTVDENGELIPLYTLSGAPGALEQFSMLRNITEVNPAFVEAGVVRVADIAKDELYSNNAAYFDTPAGDLAIVSYLAVPVISRSGAVVGGLFFGHPQPGKFTKDHETLVTSIAAQSAMGIDNAKLYEEIIALNEKKDEFIGLASHELKTPLTSIYGYLQIINRLKTDENARQKFIDKSIHQVKKLTTLVNDLLDVSKIEAGKLQLATDEFDIRAIVDDTVELTKHATNKYHISIESDVESCKVHADSQRIEQVLINLLNNAIKYSPGADKIMVSLTCGQNEVKIGVKDFGIGIPADKLTQVFSRFYRVEDVSPNISGLGLGLYISHEIIARHNGRLWAESEVGKGSTFWFTLPR